MRSSKAALHVAIIMDGNGRWATARGLARTLGHRKGVQAVRGVVEAAAGLGITDLSLFAFSSDNWRRPAEEVSGLMGLLGEYLHRETGHLAEAGVRIEMVGRRDRLPAGLPEAIAAAEQRTRFSDRLRLRVALDYSSRHALAAAMAGIAPPGTLSPRTLSPRPLSPEDLAGLVAAHPSTLPDVDLLIRTGGEKRLSDFLLWESAYAELAFTDVPWPDFTVSDLAGAVAEFQGRDRRFGAVPGGAGAPHRARPGQAPHAH